MGDLLIIKTNKLRKLISKGPRYRESVISAKSNILEGIDKPIRSWSNKKALPEVLSTQQKSKLSECIEEKNAKLQSSNICPRKNHTSLQNKSGKEALKDLHDRYVITLIDEKNGNLTLICKRFCELTLLRELGINNSQSTNACEHGKNVNHDTFLKKHSDDLLKYFGIPVSEDKRLPSIRWLPKLRNNPTKASLL